MREWFISEMPEALVESVHDVQMVLQYLDQRHDLDAQRVGMFGTGSGATISILASAIDPRIQALDALQPWGDWPDWMAKSSIIPETERPDYVKPQFLASVAPFDPLQWADRLQAKAVRVQFVLDDPITPPTVVRKLKAALPNSVQVVEYGTKRQQYEVLRGGRSFEWVKDQLRSPAVASRNPVSPVSVQAH